VFVMFIVKLLLKLVFLIISVVVDETLILKNGFTVTLIGMIVVFDSVEFEEFVALRTRFTE